MKRTSKPAQYRRLVDARYSLLRVLQWDKRNQSSASRSPGEFQPSAFGSHVGVHDDPQGNAVHLDCWRTRWSRQFFHQAPGLSRQTAETRSWPCPKKPPPKPHDSVLAPGQVATTAIGAEGIRSTVADISRDKAPCASDETSSLVVRAGSTRRGSPAGKAIEYLRCSRDDHGRDQLAGVPMSSVVSESPDIAAGRTSLP